MGGYMKNKQILLTGGSGGLGQGLIPLALRRGAHVTIPYLTEKSVENLRKKLAGNSIDQILFVRADMTNEQDVQRVIAAMQNIDILIHLIGGFSMGPTHAYTLQKWQKQINLNLTSAFLTSKHSLIRMRQQNYGRIVTIASRAALEPAAEMAAYSASKAGVIALTKSIAEETKGMNITANVILPSIIDTPNNRKNMGPQQAHKWVKPESLAQVILFLASEEAKDIRGSAVTVYGNA
jgi:NAD(P)-dependent dehydrogenase (short-subunit alcohol dehydrogenase family)